MQLELGSSLAPDCIWCNESPVLSQVLVEVSIPRTSDGANYQEPLGVGSSGRLEVK